MKVEKIERKRSGEKIFQTLILVYEAINSLRWKMIPSINFLSPLFFFRVHVNFESLWKEEESQNYKVLNGVNVRCFLSMLLSLYFKKFDIERVFQTVQEEVGLNLQPTSCVRLIVSRFHFCFHLETYINSFVNESWPCVYIKMSCVLLMTWCASC